jgi:very-short-patch-repair endonuclease
MMQNSMLKPKGNSAEQVLAYQCIADGLTGFEQEYVFCETRKYRLDLAFPEQRIGIEIEGAIWAQGAHSRPIGIKRDMAKGNLLVLCGWRVLRYTPDQVKRGEALEGLKQLLIRKLG